MLNILFITMMFGTALPILFPIAMISYSVLAFQDVFLLVYFAKAPPTYDENLNLRVLQMMRLAPIFLLGFGFW
jgi:hypothetical protein